MVKEKPDQIRIYDEDGYRQRAACLCVRNESESEVLLVSSSKNSDLWIVPGGGVEPEESHCVAANQERKHRTVVYVMVVTEEMPEWEDSIKIGRKRKWFSAEEALEKLPRNGSVVYFQHLRHFSMRKNQNSNSTTPCENGSSTASSLVNVGSSE
ncbi:Diphosphoinositol polyphosphate phosphohydrolase 1 [Orchesella cincta]|uniref:Diphosphoinositol polyphosphate phosphohydrolase 1 n=1 Tax=Orchesella cincta TaxID=48709 RepID=A0A1D2NJM2_ORCCI|nr:Diphosphoinositol polyphosphate phosphohydrolase 1 [Orchesella cincta]